MPVPADPFWPASAHYDEIAVPAGQGQTFFLASALEQFERAANYSSPFAGPTSYLSWLSAQPFAATEMTRRMFLQAARARQPIAIPPKLRDEAPDHLNAVLWRQKETITAL